MFLPYRGSIKTYKQTKQNKSSSKHMIFALVEKIGFLQEKHSTAHQLTGIK